MSQMARRPRYPAIAGLTICLVVGACTFNTSTRASVDDGGVGDDSGSTLGTRPDAIAPEDCPDDIHIEIQVAGASEIVANGQPYLHILVGDTVELSAVGTCTRSGVISYRWFIEPGTTQIEDTARPDLVSESISVFPHKPEQYTVRLEVSDGNATDSLALYAFEAHGFADVDTYVGGPIKDLSAGADYLWVGADDAAYRGDLLQPLAAYPLVNDLYGGSTLPAKMRVHETAAGDDVWFGADDATGTAYRLTLSDGQISSHATLTDAKTRDIDDAATGVRFATDKGVALAADSVNFALERADDSNALSFGVIGSFAGRDALYPLPDGTEVDVFPGGDSIQCIADDGTSLWIGGDNKGVATVVDGAVQTIYKANDSELSHDDAEDIAADSQGDIWAATKSGVSRFKQDRQVWVPMLGDSGLGARLDLKAITIDESGGRRTIYVGGNAGLSVMRIP